MARRAHGAAIASPDGPISPKIDETTGLPLIKLPDGFRCMSYGWTGDLMSDNVGTPNLHDTCTTGWRSSTRRQARALGQGVVHSRGHRA